MKTKVRMYGVTKYFTSTTRLDKGYGVSHFPFATVIDNIKWDTKREKRGNNRSKDKLLFQKKKDRKYFGG